MRRLSITPTAVHGVGTRAGRRQKGTVTTLALVHVLTYYCCEERWPADEDSGFGKSVGISRMRQEYVRGLD